MGTAGLGDAELRWISKGIARRAARDFYVKWEFAQITCEFAPDPSTQNLPVDDGHEQHAPREYTRGPTYKAFIFARLLSTFCRLRMQLPS
jgi:hypothetical protein